MALDEELTATQLLQGYQKKDPRTYDLFNIIIKNLKNINTLNPATAPRTIRLATTSGGTSTVTINTIITTSIYQAQKRVSVRI